MDDDLGWSWPYWKFGMKKDDLFSTLHAKYNTFPSAIQDPSAFHHDVFEISTAASSENEFYRLLDERRSQRLRELDDSLTSASLEIISNPSLIGTEQWEHAVQLFRTKSLDSLVRYFASYLPQSHPWHRDARDGVGSMSDAESSVGGSDTSHVECPSFFDDAEDNVVLTHEPVSYSKSDTVQFPPTPRSMTMRSDNSTGSSPIDCGGHHHQCVDALTPLRTLSFSESEPDHLDDLKGSIPTLPDDEDLSQPDDLDSPATSISDLEEIEAPQEDLVAAEVYDDEVIRHEYMNITKLHADSLDSGAATPKPGAPSVPASSFFDTRPASSRCLDLSSSRSHPHHHIPTLYHHHDCRRPHRPVRRRDYSPDVGRRRRGLLEQGSRVQKGQLDSLRSRPRGRRCAER